MIKTIKKVGSNAKVIFAGSNLYKFLDHIKDNNKYLFDKHSWDFNNNMYFGIPLVELDHGKWGTDPKFSNRAIVLGEDSIQLRTNDQHLTPEENDGIKNIGDSRTMKEILVIFYMLLAPINRADCGQIYFPDLEIPTSGSASVKYKKNPRS